ncbi:hypothetical protein IQ06DRAFT_106206 [Phaeosphaeriaceae sp. SRC1lsM3a]|nr:hypothetical protein IQ06DRAFT_106206 [Stagonospora sp. SRC1lsM3a]
MRLRLRCGSFQSRVGLSMIFQGPLRSPRSADTQCCQYNSVRRYKQVRNTRKYSERSRTVYIIMHRLDSDKTARSWGAWSLSMAVLSISCCLAVCLCRFRGRRPFLHHFLRLSCRCVVIATIPEAQELPEDLEGAAMTPRPILSGSVQNSAKLFCVVVQATPVWRLGDQNEAAQRLFGNKGIQVTCGSN